MTLREYLKKDITALEPPAVEDELVARAYSYEALPILCELLPEHMGDSYPVNQAMHRLIEIDGKNTASHGDKEVLRLAREAASQDKPSVPAIQYLALKGDGNDIAVLEKAKVWSHNGDDLKLNSANAAIDVLKARANGTNVMGTSRDPKTLYLDFIPSVANTGPQALYVRYLLRKAREMAERAPFKIPEELIKLTVSFDADGNPVSSVDLAKYGLSMPIITPKPDPRNPASTRYTVVFPHEQGEGWAPPPPVEPEAPATEGAARQPAREEAEPPPPEHPAAPPSGKPLLWLAALLAAIASAVIWKRKR